MNLLGYIAIAAGPALAIAWLVSEFKWARRVRISLGLLALVVTGGVASMATLIINQLNYNAWYGGATKELLEESIRGIEEGRTASVVAQLKEFTNRYEPTYKNRAKYLPLVEEMVERLKQDGERK